MSTVRERITIEGVRARFPVSKVTIWRRIRDGEFPAPHYLATRRFWFADEVDAWIEAEAARPRPKSRAGRPRKAASAPSP